MNRQSLVRRRSSPVLRSAVAYFGIVFGIGFLLGLVRVPFLVPRIGERAAELAEMPIMFLAIFMAAGYIVRKFSCRARPSHWGLVGVTALGLLICAELLLAAALAGQGIAEYIRSRDPVSGTVYLAMLAVFAAMPWLRRGLGRTDNGINAGMG